MQEVERKYLEADFTKVRTRLQQLSALQSVAPHFEANTVYDTEEGVLRKSDRLLRIRSREWKGKEEAILTGKLRLPDCLVNGQRVKRCEERECLIESAEKLAGILHLLGYRPCLRYEKVRESWSLLGAEIDMDILPFGKVIEIEADPEHLAAAEQALELGELPTSADTYRDLHAAWREKQGLPPEESFVFSEEERNALRLSLGLSV